MIPFLKDLAALTTRPASGRTWLQRSFRVERLGLCGLLQSSRFSAASRRAIPSANNLAYCGRRCGCSRYLSTGVQSRGCWSGRREASPLRRCACPAGSCAERMPMHRAFGQVERIGECRNYLRQGDGSVKALRVHVEKQPRSAPCVSRSLVKPDWNSASFPGLTDAIRCRTSVFMVNISAANGGGYYPNGAQHD